jgi:hypothetical protein
MCCLAQHANAEGMARASIGVGFGAEAVPNVLLALDAGRRVSPKTIIGVHVAAAPIAKVSETDVRAMFNTHTTYSMVPLQLGIMAQLNGGESNWLTPWLGVQYAFETDVCETVDDKTVPGGSTTTRCGAYSEWDAEPQIAFGLAVGYDVWTSTEGRVTVFGSISVALPQNPGISSAFAGAWLGVGYTIQERTTNIAAK